MPRSSSSKPRNTIPSHAYPSAYRQYFEDALRAEGGIVITCSDADSAEKLRFALYRFRTQLLRESDVLGTNAQLLAMIWTKGSNELSLKRRVPEGVLSVQSVGPATNIPPIELPSLSHVEAQLRGGAVSPPATLQGAEDPMEEALRKLGMFTNIEKREKNS